MTQPQLAEKHSFVKDTVFRFKTVLLTGNRFLKNLLAPVTHFKNKGQLLNEPIISVSESELWNASDNEANWVLTAGKVENLRIASSYVNGLEIKANEVFSFWKHMGNPNFGKGYVVGREIREGCIVPTVAGGLCQLSNAIYDAALKADFDIIERHKHTKVIKGSLAEQDRDATVKWNYIDLRFKSAFDFRMEVELTQDKLIVVFKSKQKNIKQADENYTARQSNKLNDCYSCGNFACFKHPDRTGLKQERALTTYILDERFVEFDTYIKKNASAQDYFIVPLKKNKLLKTDRYYWASAPAQKTSATTLQGIYRALKLRYFKNANVFELGLKLDRHIAHAAAKKIKVECTHVVVSQNLLPFVFETGALGGRTFDVLMTRLPIEKLQQRLDIAYLKYANSPTLKDFRATQQLLDLENRALTKAQKIITPHADIANMFKNKVEKLTWHVPEATNENKKGNKILFTGGALGRKGAYEMKQLAQELNLPLSILGNASEKANFWEDVKTEKFNGDFSEIGLVIYPTYIEHQPRQILKAIANNIPVITTTACGIEPTDKITIIEIGNYEQLKNKVVEVLNITI